MPTSTPHLLRLGAVLTRTGCGSRSSWYRWCAEGLAPRPVRVGPNSAAWPAAEIDALLAARIAGADDTAVRELVRRLHAERQATTAAA